MGTNASGKKITWKVLAIFLAVLMLITALPMSAFAAKPKSNIDGITVNGGQEYYDFYEGDKFVFEDLEGFAGITVDIDVKDGTDITGVTPADFWRYGLYVTPNDGTVLGMGENGLAVRVCYGDEANFTGRYADLGQIRMNVANQWSAVLVEGRNDFTSKDFYVIAVDSNGDGKPDTALTDIATAKPVAFNDKDTITYGKPLTGAPIELDGFTVKKVTEEMLWQIRNVENENGMIAIRDAKVVPGNGIETSDWKVAIASADAFGKKTLPIGISENMDPNDLAARWTITDSSDAYVYTEDENVGDNKFYNLTYTVKDENGAGNYFSVVKERKGNLKDEWGKFWFYRMIPAYVKDIEVKKDPAKMVYFEGETLSAEGMVVTLKYSNGYTRDIPAELFNAFGIVVNPFLPLTVATDNNQPIVAALMPNDLNQAQYPMFDAGNGRLVVKAKTVMAYTLADFVDGKLPDGQYVITGLCDKGDAYEATEVHMLNNKPMGIYANSKVKGLGADDNTVANKMLDPENVTLANVFKVTKTVNGYTIQDSEGKYLTRTPFNKNFNNLELVDDISKDVLAATWQITGTFNEDVWGNDATSKKSGSFWLVNGHGDFAATSNDKLVGYTTELSFYAVSVKGFTKLEVLKQPGLDYVEGEKLDLNGLTVALYDEDGNKTVVTYEDFSAYGITTSMAQGAALAAADNGKAINVALGNAKADTAALKIYGPDLNTYTLAEELTDGKYIIVAKDNKGDNATNFRNDGTVTNGLETIYRYHALSTIPTSVKYPFGKPLTLNASAALNTMENSLTGKPVTVEDKKITSKVTSDMIWTIKAVKDKDGKVVSYDIIDANGNYLERTPALENGFDIVNVITVPAAEKNADGYYNAWQISGTKGAEIYTENMKYKETMDAGRYYLGSSVDTLMFGQDAYCIFGAVYYDKYDVKGMEKYPEEYAFLQEILRSFDLYKVNGVVTTFELTKAPKLSYINGEKLDLSGAEFHVVSSDGTDAKVAYADIAKYGITVSLENGKALSLSDNGTVITATCGGKTINVGTLAVSAVDFTRLSGATRIETALKIADTGWETSDYVVLASALTYADALAGAPLATAYDAPILLTKGDALEANVLAQIKDLKAKQVIILGGTKAVSANVAASLTANGINSTRIDGIDRTETSTKIAAALFTKTGATADEFFFVRSDDFADALSVSSIAGIKKSPIIYVNKSGDLDATVVNYLKSISTAELKSTIIVGGESAIGAAAETALKGYFKSVDRIGGIDRYDTSIKVVKAYDALFTSKDVAVATGKNYPDALAGGAFAAKNKMPVLLVADGNGTVAVRDYIKNKADFGTLYCFGGELALSNDTVATLLN